MLQSNNKNLYLEYFYAVQLQSMEQDIFTLCNYKVWSRGLAHFTFL
jgi:hypothetical protein